MDTVGLNDIDGEKSDEDYDFLIDEDDVESESNEDASKVKENVMKDKAKKLRLTQFLESSICSRIVIGSNREGLVECDELGDVFEDFEGANSPSESGDDERDKTKGTKISCPRFNPSVIAQDVELKVGLQFADKRQFRTAFENYRIVKGLNIKIITSDMHRFQGLSVAMRKHFKSRA